MDQFHSIGHLVEEEIFEYLGEFDKSKRHGIGMFKKGDSTMPKSLSQTIEITDGLGGSVFSNRTLAGTKKKSRLPNLENYMYLGEFFQDEISGHGQYMLKDGSTIRGQFFEGKLESFGEIKMKNPKIVIIGNFDQGKKNGYCKTVTPFSQFSGMFSEDIKQGLGILKESNDVYQGYFENGMKHGFGEIKYRCMDKKYIGEMKFDLKNGIGKQSIKSKKEVYIGSF